VSVSSGAIADAAKALREAYETRSPCAPLRDLFGFDAVDVDTGYAIQQINTDIEIGKGRRVTGRKIGLTSKAVQEQLGVDSCSREPRPRWRSCSNVTSTTGRTVSPR
jgi:2-keto-4-pentenoate hydratase